MSRDGERQVDEFVVDVSAGYDRVPITIGPLETKLRGMYSLKLEAGGLLYRIPFEDDYATALAFRERVVSRLVTQFGDRVRDAALSNFFEALGRRTPLAKRAA